VEKRDNTIIVIEFPEISKDKHNQKTSLFAVKGYMTLKINLYAKYIAVGKKPKGV